MTLPDVARLHTLPADGWRAFARRLQAIGLTGQAVTPFVLIASRALSPLRAPLAKWHARRVDEPYAWAFRMMMLWDAVTTEQARAVLGEELPLERMLEAGLFRETGDGRVVSPYVLNLVNSTFILCDDLRAGGEAVMGAGPTTIELARAAHPQGRIGSALEIGCGAAAASLLFAPACERVVATDISERAIAVARVNAWMNGIGNVEFRQGDLFAPVAGERFDLVVSQPPFIARYEDEPSTTFLFGGARGDELPERLLRSLPEHLTPGGHAFVLVEWPIVAGEAPLEERVRGMLGPAGDLSLLMLKTVPSDLDEHCARYAQLDHGDLGQAYEEHAIRRREHFARMKIDELRATFNVVRRSTDGSAGWTSTLRLRDFERVQITRARIDAILAARDVTARGPGALLEACLRVPDGVTFAQSSDGQLTASFTKELLVDPLVLTESTMRMVTLVNDSDSVREALDRLAASLPGTPPGLAKQALDGVQNALLYGLLEVA